MGRYQALGKKGRHTSPETSGIIWITACAHLKLEAVFGNSGLQGAV